MIPWVFAIVLGFIGLLIGKYVAEKCFPNN